MDEIIVWYVSIKVMLDVVHKAAQNISSASIPPIGRLEFGTIKMVKAVSESTTESFYTQFLLIAFQSESNQRKKSIM